MQLRKNDNILEIYKSEVWKPLCIFKGEIGKFQYIDDNHIIVRMIYHLKDECRNIYCIDSLGNLIWQIEKAPHTDPIHTELPNPYINFVIENGKLMAHSMRGHNYEVNIESGRVTFVCFNPW